MISSGTPANVIHDNRSSHRLAATAGRDWRGVALGCLSIYLAMSGIVLCVGGEYWLGVVHVVLLEVTRRAWRPRSSAMQVAGDLLPLLVFPILYSELPHLIAALGMTYHDATVQRWETALFASQPSRTLAGGIPSRWLSELLHAGYLAYYPVIFLPPMRLYARGENTAFSATVAGLAITYAVCWMIYAVFPVQGPRYVFGPPFKIPFGQIRTLTLWLLASGSARGAAFPSSHVAIAMVQTLMAWRWQRRTVWLLAPITILIGVGAVYGGFHYAIDVIAGAAVAVVIATVLVLQLPHTRAG